jgi:hypothetical protein
MRVQAGLAGARPGAWSQRMVPAHGLSGCLTCKHLFGGELQTFSERSRRSGGRGYSPSLASSVTGRALCTGLARG